MNIWGRQNVLKNDLACRARSIRVNGKVRGETFSASGWCWYQKVPFASKGRGNKRKIASSRRGRGDENGVRSSDTSLIKYLPSLDGRGGIQNKKTFKRDILPREE